jgi:hypothetical protein
MLCANQSVTSGEQVVIEVNLPKGPAAQEGAMWRFGELQRGFSQT